MRCQAGGVLGGWCMQAKSCMWRGVTEQLGRKETGIELDVER